jgi:ComF family protein
VGRNLAIATPVSQRSGSARPLDASWVRRWLAAGLDLVYPPRCACCRAPLAGGEDVLLCDDCRETMLSSGGSCPRCAAAVGVHGAGLPCPACHHRQFHFSAAACLGTYDNRLRSAVPRTKDRKDRGLALALGDLLAICRREQLDAWQLDAVVPIPMHWSRRIWRGANSPTAVAQRVARHLRVPMAEHLLVRRRRTVPQATLSPRRRRANVRGAFRAPARRDLPGARLLVVDDIMTTGATLDEAAKALLLAGAAFVAVAVVARATGAS